MERTAPPTLAEVMRTLDELAAAARAGDGARYRAMQRAAQRQGLSEDQVRDAYRWGRREQGMPAFDWKGNELTKETRHAY